MVDETRPTLRTLLARPELRLRLVTPESLLPAGALERPLRWVHSSDLADPTPFLADEVALLTTGTQLALRDPGEQAAEYVARLTARGVLGLGFGTEVHRDGIPEELLQACLAAGLPLFEVPYGTPFIAIARAHSEVITATAYARRIWALDAQRALALAALRPRGLDATLSELSRRLDAPVAMFDAAGDLTLAHPAGELTAGIRRALTEHAGEILDRGLEAGHSLTIEDRTFTLLTIGRGGQLRGVIALGTAGMDAEARAVVTSVIAMAGLALQQSDELARSTRRLHARVLASLLTDDPTVAVHVMERLPSAPVLVAVATDAPSAAIASWWERRATDDGAVVFLADSDGRLTMCVSAADEVLLDQLAQRFGIRIGVSEPEDYDAFSRAHAQAVLALQRGSGPGVIRYADAVGSQMLTALATDEARLVAESFLAPLREHDARQGTALEATLHAWLTHDTRSEAAAAALGVHRHTVRARIAQAASLLGTDLTGFPARAELWAALQTVRDQ